MGKVEEYTAGRMQGLLQARDIVKSGGLEELEGDKKMRTYNVKLPRGLEVDIFNLPEDFEEQVKEAFQEYTAETARDYRYCDKLSFIDCCVRHLNHDVDSYDAVDQMAEDAILYQWREYGEVSTKDSIYDLEFMQACYEAGQKSARVYSRFGSDDHHIYDQIQQVLVQVITIVMNYEEKAVGK